jgi:TatD DNase family protein
MTFTDTHCHIHEETYADAEAVYLRAIEAGITRMICIGTDVTSSQRAIEFAKNHDDVWASVGIHPHEAAGNGSEELKELIDARVVAVGECGLDYFYEHSPREKQIETLHAQINLAIENNLPMIFHVRDAFDDFWPIFDQYQGLRGVLHSFTDSQQNLDKALERGLFIGVNGISTFTKVEEQKKMYASIPTGNLLLETDSPFLTPVPLRGIVNEPAFITHIAQHIVNLQSITLEELSRATERNATTLFSLNK